MTHWLTDWQGYCIKIILLFSASMQMWNFEYILLLAVKIHPYPFSVRSFHFEQTDIFFHTTVHCYSTICLKVVSPNFLGAIASLAASMTHVIKVIVREEEHWQKPVPELLGICDSQYRDSVQLVRIMVQILFCWCWSLNLKAFVSCVLFCWWQVAINLTKAV